MWHFQVAVLHITEGSQSPSSHSRTDWLRRQEGLLRWPTGFSLAIARRFISRSIVAYRFVVLGLECPNHWLIAVRSTPEARSATAVLWRMLCGCRRLRVRVLTWARARFRCFARMYRTPKRVSGSSRWLRKTRASERRSR